MATRIIRLHGTAFGTGGAVLEDEDGNQFIQPPNGIKWTIVEIRMAMSAAGYAHGFFDTEKYHSLRQAIDFLAKGVPQTVTLDVVQPHQYSITVFADSGTIDADAELVIEESPAA